jgi:uncharacterized protein YdhG (YjbR/CyaY superfamily)
VLAASCTIARMKKSTKKKSAKRASVVRSTAKAAPKTVSQYLARVPAPARGPLRKIREAIRSVAPPDAAETISYGIPAFKRRRILVWYAAFSDHCSLFPTAAVIAEFKDELKGYSPSKGTIHFPLSKPLPVGLIKKLVKARVKQEERRSTTDKHG